MVLVEAQACGKVVIAGDSGGTGETMLPQQTGFIIDCTKADSIAKTIKQLLSDPRLSRSICSSPNSMIYFLWRHY